MNGLTFSTPYYFAIKALDEYGNLSPLSNVATATTLGAAHGGRRSDVSLGGPADRRHDDADADRQQRRRRDARLHDSRGRVHPAGEDVLRAGRAARVRRASEGRDRHGSAHPGALRHRRTRRVRLPLARQRRGGRSRLQLDRDRGVRHAHHDHERRAERGGAADRFHLPVLRERLHHVQLLLERVGELHLHIDELQQLGAPGDRGARRHAGALLGRPDLRHDRTGLLLLRRHPADHRVQERPALQRGRARTRCRSISIRAARSTTCTRR